MNFLYSQVHVRFASLTKPHTASGQGTGPWAIKLMKAWWAEES